MIYETIATLLTTSSNQKQINVTMTWYYFQESWNLDAIENVTRYIQCIVNIVYIIFCGQDHLHLLDIWKQMPILHRQGDSNNCHTYYKNLRKHTLYNNFVLFTTHVYSLSRKNHTKYHHLKVTNCEFLLTGVFKSIS